MQKSQLQKENNPSTTTNCQLPEIRPKNMLETVQKDATIATDITTLKHQHVRFLEAVTLLKTPGYEKDKWSTLSRSIASNTVSSLYIFQLFRKECVTLMLSDSYEHMQQCVEKMRSQVEGVRQLFKISETIITQMKDGSAKELMASRLEISVTLINEHFCDVETFLLQNTKSIKALRRADKRLELLNAVRSDGLALNLECNFWGRRDWRIALNAVAQNSAAYSLLSDELQKDEDIMIAAIRGGFSLEEASEEQKKNKQLVLYALKNYAKAFMWADSALQSDVEFVKKAVSVNGLALAYVQDKFKDNINVVLSAVNSNQKALEYATERLKLQAVKTSYQYYKYCGDGSRANQEIALEAVSQKARVINKVPHQLANNPDFVKQILSRQGIILEYLPKRFKDDENLVLLAMSQNKDALQFASGRIQELYAKGELSALGSISMFTPTKKVNRAQECSML